MSKTFIIILVIQAINIGLMRYIGKNFIMQPDWNVPRIFWNPVIAKILVIGTQFLLVAIIVLAFFLTDHPWWFLLGSVAAFFVFATPPYGRSMLLGVISTLYSRTGPGKYRAAKNALVAKYTFESLGEEHKKKIDIKIIDLLVSGGIPVSEAGIFKNDMRETQYYGMAAVAMAALIIEPGLPGILFKNWWENVRNPLVALTGAEREIEMVCNEIQRKHRVALTISDADR